MSRSMDTKLYDGTVTLSRDAAHRYTINGEVYPSVTQVLATEPKPQLEKWKLKTALDAALKARKVGATMTEAKAIGMQAPQRKATEAADRGSLIHDMAESYLRHQLFPKGGVTDKEQRALDAFAGWTDHHFTRVLAQERPVVSLVHRYVGTFDILATTRESGIPQVWDIKTGKRAYPAVVLQLAAYVAALTEEYPEQGVEVGGVLLFERGHDGQLTGGFQAIHLDHTKVYGESRGAFIALRRLMQWQSRQESMLWSAGKGIVNKGVDW